MKTKYKIIVLSLILPLLNLAYLFLYRRDNTTMGYLDSFVGSIGKSIGTMLVLMLINLIFNFLINRKWKIQLSMLNFIVYALIIIGMFLMEIVINQENYTEQTIRIKEKMVLLNDELTKYDNEINLNPHSSRLYLNRGQVKFDLSDLNGAIKDFDKCIEIDSTDIESYIFKAYALYKLNDYKNSITCCTKAIQIDPNNIKAYLMRSKSKIKIGDIEGAQIDSIKASYMIAH